MEDAQKLIILASALNFVLFIAQLVIVFFSSNYILIVDTFNTLADAIIILSPYLIVKYKKCCEYNDTCLEKKYTKLNLSTALAGFNIGFRFIILLQTILASIYTYDIPQDSTMLIVIGSIGAVLNFCAFLALEVSEKISHSSHDGTLIQSIIYCLVPDIIGSIVIMIVGVLLRFDVDIDDIKYFDLSCTLVLCLVFMFLSGTIFIKNHNIIINLNDH